MKKINRFIIVGVFIVAAIILCLLGNAVMVKQREQASQFYNVLYYNNGTKMEYYDVTELYYDKVGVYFKTCDGATVILNSGAIEIIPLDVD